MPHVQLMSLGSHPVAPYRIELDSFTGPLDLLLHLIDRNELDVTVISLAEVTGQYLAQINQMGRDRTANLMDFLVVGARLLVIKSRALLPRYDSPILGDELEEEDPGEALARQLRTYRRFKGIGAWLQDREELGLRTYLRVTRTLSGPNRPDLSGVTIATLISALHGALDRQGLLKDSVSVAVDKYRFTVDRQMQLLRDLLLTAQSVYFEELLSSGCTWSEVSATLLAVLELIKRQEVNAFQKVLFGPIELVRTSDERSG